MSNKEERQQRIIQLIQQPDGQQILGTKELAENLGVSEMTVRRDLQELSREGLLMRQHGGAAPIFQRDQPRKREIGILLVSRNSKYSDPFFNAVLEGVDQKLQTMGYRIAYINTNSEINSAAKVKSLMESIAVDGIIMVGPPLSMESTEYIKANMRALVSTTMVIGLEQDAILFDGYNGIRQMIDHLVSNGRRRLAFITGQHDTRRQGFIDGVQAHQLLNSRDLDELCLTLPSGIDGWTPQLGHEGARQLMQLSNPPDAILCASDLIAIGVIQWLHQHKIRIPEDVAVTGFDNIPESAFTVPSLTTVHVHKQLIGALAAERVVRRIENEDEVPLLIQTPTSLLIRHSCGS